MQHLFFWEATRTPISTSFLNIALLDICHTNWWIFVSIIFWLVVSTHLKNTNQNGNLPQIGINIKNIWNHHLLLHQNVPKARWTLWFKNLRLNSPPLFFQSASQARGDAFVDPAGGSRWIGYDQVRLDFQWVGTLTSSAAPNERLKEPVAGWKLDMPMGCDEILSEKSGVETKEHHEKPKTFHISLREKENHQKSQYVSSQEDKPSLCWDFFESCKHVKQQRLRWSPKSCFSLSS